MEDPKDNAPDNEEVQPSGLPDAEAEATGPVAPSGSGIAVPQALRKMMAALDEAAEELDAEEQARLKELYGEETFEDDGLTYGDDLAKYDQPAYTRKAQDYTAYRYNLNTASTYKPVPNYTDEELNALGDEEFDGLASDLNAGSAETGRTTFGGAPAKGHTYYPSSAGKGSYSYGYSYASGGSWANSAGGWQSSWYSGYKSADVAIQGVHDSVSSFVTAPGFGALEIVPDLESVDSQTCIDPDLVRKTNNHYDSYDRIGSVTEKTMVVRIDSTLYEKLGIAEAQQHYIVDAISQVFAIQTYPDPFVVTLLQSGTHGTVIPSVTKEIITEMMRAKGLPALLDQMPGWLKRVTAFRSAMYIGEPPDGSIASAYLMYGIWEKDAVTTLEQEDAIAAIGEIEALLAKPAEYLLALADKRTSVETKAKVVEEARRDIITDIDTVLVRYITGYGSAGEVLRLLRLMYKVLTAKMDLLASTTDEEDQDAVYASEETFLKDTCEQLMPLIHDHNRTFCPDPADTKVVRHLDFPECPNLQLLRSEIKARIEFTRKCFFNLVRIPTEGITKGPSGLETTNVKTAARRVKDMIEHIEKTVAALLEAAERASAGDAGNRDPDGNRGNTCTNHPELRMKNPIGGSVERNFNGEDPAFSRPVKVLDSTI